MNELHIHRPEYMNVRAKKFKHEGHPEADFTCIEMVIGDMEISVFCEDDKDVFRLWDLFDDALKNIEIVEH